MPRLVEDVEGAVAELEVAHQLPSLRLVVVHDQEPSRARLRAQYEVDETTVEQRLAVEESGDVANVSAAMAHHAAARDSKARCVRDESHLHRELRPIGEGRDHLRLLAPLSGEVL